jgi:translation initiation factor IF-2
MVTFLDTPGHAAFTALRARGAQATDLVILVVAADDGVMPQTVEAVNHAKAAGVPIIVAVNKIDKPGANPERVKQAMTEFELIPEEWGGQTIFSEVSALHGAGLDELLEAVILQAEILELTANPTRRAHGLVIESSLDIGRGAVATVLVQRGTLRAGDIVVAGEHFGRIRKMYDHLGVSVTEVTPSMPAEITGLSGVPNAGEQFFAVEDDRTARDIVSHVQRTNRDKEAVSRAQRPGGLAELTRMMQEGQLKELKVIVKADVQGSVEAIIGSLGKLGNEEVQVRIIHSAVGGITENDVNLAASSAEGAVIVGFNVRPESRANALAEERGIELILSSIIYDVENTIKSALEGMLAPILTEKTTGHAEVRETFIVPKVGTIAGVLIHDGRINRGTKCRVVRGGAIMTTSTIGTLKRFKDDVREVKSGFECGLSVDNFNDIKIGDTIECFEIEQHAAKLE